jgi:signal transduction histidine kinase
MSIFSSLSNRIFFASALLAVVSIGVAVYRVHVAVTAQAERELQLELAEAAGLLESYRATLLDHLRREARLIADLPRLKAAVVDKHEPTARPIVEQYQQELGADVLLVTDRDGRPIVRAGPVRLDGVAPGSLATVREAQAGREAVSFWPGPDGLLEVVSVPIWILAADRPEIFGTLTVGFSLDDRAAARFRALTKSEIAFVHDGRVVAATVPRAHWPVLASVPRGGVVRRTLGDEEYAVVARPLAAAGRPAGGAPVALVLRSRTERLRVLTALHGALATTALVAVLAATLVSFALARTVTRPLAAITATMRHMAATGDLTRRIPEPPATRWDDEDARLLARTFNAMTESIARFQREAAQRERLSSLGRLSTVVAHEIRNPLMIIKAAVRTLRREDADPERVRRALADIDEEVARLNRIVSEVLDFAKPIRFEPAPADLNAICRDAVRAVADGDQAPEIAVDCDPTIGPVVTDGERLRLALVNLLTNARQAVEMRDGAGPRRIAIETRRIAPDRVRIAVRDTGRGIPPEDLPRVFEPYFTTKRTGSGLGLAITRNIVEGLGGTIAVESRPEEGTTMIIELPVAPPAAAATGPGAAPAGARQP